MAILMSVEARRFACIRSNVVRVEVFWIMRTCLPSSMVHDANTNKTNSTQATDNSANPGIVDPSEGSVILSFTALLSARNANGAPCTGLFFPDLHAADVGLYSALT